MKRDDAQDLGNITRRGFLGEAGKLAVAGLAAGTVIEGLGADRAFADARAVRRSVVPRPQRVVVIGIDHYHAISPPNYLQILSNEKLDILGIHAPDEALAQKYAAQYKSTAYTDYRAMVEKTKPEFIMALGKHSAMPDEFRYLVTTGIPFLMEKPWATDDKMVNELADLAESKKVWAGVPTPYRFNWLTEVARKMKAEGTLGKISHMHVRFNNGGIQRYKDLGNDWMLTKKDAGGGCWLNLAGHGIDQFRYITDEEPKVIGAVTSHAMFNLEIEDWGTMLMRTPEGTILVNESGYTAKGPDTEHLISTDKVLLRETRGGVEIHSVDGTNTTSEQPKDFRAGWPGYVHDALDRIANGQPPLAGPRDAARNTTLIVDAMRVAGESIVKA
ncbi:MAG TPA: Gfo/Idh/MocA family oxidoreductase, partial [Vicinamibacterales bacterium]